MVEDSGARPTDGFSPWAVAGSRSCPAFMPHDAFVPHDSAEGDSAEGASATRAVAERAAVDRATEPAFGEPWQFGRLASRDDDATAMIRSVPRSVHGRRRGHCKS